jgi:hypothetical protein
MLLLKVTDVAHPPAAYVLALADSFGGSLVIAGSVSNIMVVQQARDLGIDISFRAFARLGIPVTLASLGDRARRRLRVWCVDDTISNPGWAGGPPRGIRHEL